LPTLIGLFRLWGSSGGGMLPDSDDNDGDSANEQRGLALDPPFGYLFVYLIKCSVQLELNPKNKSASNKKKTNEQK
jgi:hypothetical protein